jgi:uncharacterized protein
MSVEVMPVGIKCNLSCSYCYQNPMRDAGNFDTIMNVEKMIEALDNANQSFTIFGGEALLTPFPILEKLFKYGYEKYGSNGIQTNGTLITEKHIELFEKYKVHVGFSLDGPGELNDLRWAGSQEKTRLRTARSHTNLTNILRAGRIDTSLIVTLHKHNASGDRLKRLKDWFIMLSNLGLRYARLHLLEVDHDLVENASLTEDESFTAIIELAELDHNISIDMFSDIPRMMKGEDFSPTCIWTGCDPFNTSAVHGINPDGTLSNCGRTNKDGINWLKSDTSWNERHHALINTPQEYGGCKDCRYFPICRGECPGESADWRNKTRHCGLLMRLFQYYEERIGYNPRYDVEGNSHNDTPHLDHYDFVNIQVEVRV